MSIVSVDRHRSTVLLISLLAFLPASCQFRLNEHLKGAKLDRAFKKLFETEKDLSDWFGDHFEFDPLHMNFCEEMRICLNVQAQIDLLVHKDSRDRIFIDISKTEAVRLCSRYGVTIHMLRKSAAELNRILNTE